MDKRDVARILDEIALLLELKGENPFKIRAYGNAARAVDGLTDDLGARVEAGTLREVAGIGDSMATKITELWRSGRLKYYDDLVDSIPPGYLEMIRVPGLGSKKVRMLGDSLGIKSLAALKDAATKGEIRGLKGFGIQSEKKILEGIAVLEAGSQRSLAGKVRPIAERLADALAKHPDVERIEIGGSLRRWLETAKDVDLLVSTKNAEAVTHAFLELVPEASITGSGETKTSIRFPSGLAVDLRLVTPKQFPFALHYFTGSVAHNIRVRARAQERGMSLNEYDLTGKKHPPIRTEQELFEYLGLAYIEPELREDMGEIEAAQAGLLPKLVTRKDFRGILHCHTTASDGKSTLEEMARAAEAWGAEYLGIADHSQTVVYAKGLREDDLKVQGKAIDKWNAGSKKLRLLKGTEVDILADGSLDYPDRVLARLDYVVASIHSNLTMPSETMTKRIVKALRNKYVSVLGHPTGRILLERDGVKFDFEEVVKVAAEEGVALEINAHPHRLDLDWMSARAAKERGVRLSVNPDAHHVSGIEDMRYGIGVARKAWLTKKDIVNTLPADKLLALFASRR